MASLYLRADLFKADPRGVYSGATVETMEGPKKQRASEKMSPHMRVKPTKMTQTPRTMGGEYMRRIATVKQREPYKCEGEGRGLKGKGCGVTVHPGGMEHIEDVPGKQGDPHRVMTAIEQGAEYVRKTKTGHLVEHPPQVEVTKETHPERQKELGPLGHKRRLPAGVGAVSAEHIDRKLCPECHAKLTKRETVAVGRGKTPEKAKEQAEKIMGTRQWPKAKEQAGLKRSLELLGELLEKAAGGKKSDDWISRKISHLVKVEGKPQDQAVAIAYSMAGRSRKKKKVKKSAAVFLRGDLFKSDAPVFLRSDLCQR